MTTLLLAGGGTGGHLMPAIAVAEAVKHVHPDWRAVFAGAHRGIEARVLPERGLPHHLLPLEPIYRQQWWKNLKWPMLALRLRREIDAMLDAERPDVVIGTGGYVSGPVVWGAARRGIPTGILDLDVHPGIASRWLSGRVQGIWVATPEAVSAFRSALRRKVIVTGAPIVPPSPERRASALNRYGFDPERQLLVVTGGSQGSLVMNRLIAEWLDRGGLGNAQLLWATGRSSYDEFTRHHRPPQIQVFPFIDPMADAWSMATLCVARAGMMTIAELCAWGIPSVLIPLPTAAADHQTLNAQALQEAGAALMLRQEGLTSRHLGETLGNLLTSPSRLATMTSCAVERGRPQAATEIAAHVINLVQARPIPK